VPFAFKDPTKNGEMGVADIKAEPIQIVYAYRVTVDGKEAGIAITKDEHGVTAFHLWPNGLTRAPLGPETAAAVGQAMLESGQYAPAKSK
jgi:hypothetical protein